MVSPAVNESVAVQPGIVRALESDLDALVALEKACFDSDRLSRRSFRHFLHRERNCFLVVHDGDGRLLGYILVLMHKGNRLARVYSLAVDAAARGRRIAESLVLESERLCADRGRILMRLEVRKDNRYAIALYERLGYRSFGEIADYYEDHADALRYQKRILHIGEAATRMPVPYYAQRTDFTCGPAALMMAMSALAPEQGMDITEELRIWREATTIYMMAGHGGCSPLGLALAAAGRGFDAEVWLSTRDTPFVDSVRGEEKKQVVRLVHDDYLSRMVSRQMPLHYENITQEVLLEALKQGSVPLILISTFRFDGKKTPHWVVVSAMDERFIYIHDPDVDEDAFRFALDNQYLPIERNAFDKMSQFGQSRLRTAVLLSR